METNFKNSNENLAYKAIEEVQADVAGCKQDIEATPAIEGLLLKERENEHQWHEQLSSISLENKIYMLSKNYKT